MGSKQEISDVLPPLVFGTATFGLQFNKDPSSLPTKEIVHKALSYGIRAFDTSPYYNSSEEILGQALVSEQVKTDFPRESYYIITKAGRIAGNEFDYSPEWINFSVNRSLERLHTNYLDVVYCHDVEFVSSEEVLTAVKELRKIRAETNAVRNIGICGYPVTTLCDLSELILRETGEPIDIIQSYANQTLQSGRLDSKAVERFSNAGVRLVTNASPLGMGFLRNVGPPIGATGDFHPASRELRKACDKAAKVCEEQGERLETVALYYAMKTWIRNGSSLGTHGPPPAATVVAKHDESLPKLGVTVIGCTYIEELDSAIATFRSIIEGVGDGKFKAVPAIGESDWTSEKKEKIEKLIKDAQIALGDWINYAWDSPDKDFVNVRGKKDT